MKKKTAAVFITGCIIILITYRFIAVADDTPHNPNSSISCGSCHISDEFADPDWADLYDETCLGCHKASSGPYSDTNAPRVKTHSSANTSDQHGTWTKQCRNCHNPHKQAQKTYAGAANLYLATGTFTSCNDNGDDTATFTYSSISYKAGWDASKLTDKTGKGAPNKRSAAVFPDVGNLNNNYSIKEVTASPNTIKVKVQSSLFTCPSQPSDFAVTYGQIIKDQIYDATNGVKRTVKFFDRTGANSFAVGDGTRDGVCEVCHTKTKHFRNDGGGSDQLHTNIGTPAGTNCTTCHNHEYGFAHGGGGGTGCGTSTTCHGTRESHTTHVSGQILSLDCSECHNISNFPQFRDGATSKSATTVCDNCHTANGVALAKQYWDYPGSSSGAVGSWAVVEGEKSFCGACHDSTPGNTKGNGTGDTALNILGNDSTYGFYLTGHGKPSGNHVRLSYQDTSATGNAAANKRCNDCHNLQTAHFNNTQKRLKADNDQNNSNCNLCHSSGGSADANPKFYTNSTDYENSAHSSKLCTECHNVHGMINWSSATYAGMTKGDKTNLCNQCHSGIGGHPGVGTKAFTIDGKDYALQCISCHNVHLVSGTYAQADQNKSPLTRFSHAIQNQPQVWGDAAGEKMNAYAGSGTYRTPKGESFSGNQLPDYPTFCLDCHGTGTINHDHPEPSPYFGITWDGEPHGKVSANQPNGYGTCPNWFGCGQAFGWDNDDCVADNKNDCWPAIPRGAGDQLWSREPYTHTERVAGANFTLSCTDCHTGHGTGTLGRSNVNGGSFTSNWNSMCNNCHWYYSDWHAGMACGNASCHTTNSIHRAQHWSGSGGTRSFNPDQVLWYRFENNLKDSSSTWQMDGKWIDDIAGAFVAGKSGLGQAIELLGGKNVQVGTENDKWSTDAGYHGTWVYTEMKFNTTLEAWVYPTDSASSEYTIFSKHVGVSNDGSYAFSLKKINGALRATFNMAADNNGVTQDGRAGVRGAYSSVAVPLNKWTHVAATFDKNGSDRNSSDLSIGRIRIYVNGEDVTTSDPSGNNMQPGVNETSIYAYSENSPWNQGICYDGQWCASEFSIGGFYGWQNEFIGRLDEAKVWNIAKDVAYFAAYDSQAGPYISQIEGLIGSNQLTIRFSEGVYTNIGSSGALVPADFILTDTGGNNPRTITGVIHTAGSSTAVITMSAPLTVADVNADSMAAAVNAIFDNNNLAAGTETVTIGLSSQCPISPVSIQLNESSGSMYIMDTQNILYGTVYGGASTLTGNEYSGGGDGSGRYIMFDYNTSCLQASTAMTIETRIKPTGLTGTGNYVRRILARDGSGNFQLSVWRNNSTYSGLYNAPAGEASIALWIYPLEAHGGNTWKPVLTNYTGSKTGAENNCPIVDDHWYLVKAVWNTNKPGGTPGQFFTPADIYIDDQGTDGAGAGENWTGYSNCTDTDQSLKTDVVKFYTGDVIKTASGESFAIGANRSNPANNLFNGLIDWIIWKDSVN